MNEQDRQVLQIVEQCRERQPSYSAQLLNEQVLLNHRLQDTVEKLNQEIENLSAEVASYPKFYQIRAYYFGIMTGAVLMTVIFAIGFLVGA